jgi:hypothetical protein
MVSFLHDPCPFLLSDVSHDLGLGQLSTCMGQVFSFLSDSTVLLANAPSYVLLNQYIPTFGLMRVFKKICSNGQVE